MSKETLVDMHDFYILRSDVKQIIDSYGFDALKELDISGKYKRYVTGVFKKDLVKRVMSYETNRDYKAEGEEASHDIT